MAVVLVFFVCWTPFHAQRLMFVIVTLNNNWTASIGSAHHVLYLASGTSSITQNENFEQFKAFSPLRVLRTAFSASRMHHVNSP